MAKNKKRPDGLIQRRVYIGRDNEGKQLYKSVYGRTQKEADDKTLEVKAAMRKGFDLSAERDTFSAWSDRWLSVKSAEISAGRLVVYQSHLKHLSRYLEHLPIIKIRTPDVQEVISDLSKSNPNTGKPMARATLTELKGTAIQIFQFAIDSRIMDYNPAVAVKLPKGQVKTQRRALTEQEQGWICDMPHRAQRAAMIMLYAGLRRGEVIPLMWSDIDLKAATINVNKTVEIVDGQFIQKNTAKSKAGIRIVDIPRRLVDYLREEKRDSLYACTSAAEMMHTPSSWDRLWESYLFNLNYKYGDFTNRPKSKFDPAGVPFVIPKITPHMLRHTFATMLYLAGVDILTAKDQLGHADVKTTLNIYTHLDSIHKRKSMSKLDDYLSSEREEGYGN